MKKTLEGFRIHLFETGRVSLKDDHRKLPGQRQTAAGLVAGGRCRARKLGQDADDEVSTIP